MQPRTFLQKIKRCRELLFGIKLERDVLPRVQGLNVVGVPCSFSYLPIESYTTQDIYATLSEYKNLVDHVALQNKYSGSINDITIKLYQFGQYTFPDICRTVIEDLVEYARVQSVFLRFDTSDRVLYGTRNVIDETIELFTYIHNKVNLGGGVNMSAIVPSKNR